MLKPAEGIEGVKQAVLETVKLAGPNACPPMVVGVGVGGDFEKCAEESFDCIGCGICTSRCPAGISHPMVGVLARRLTGKYIAPKSQHLKERVEAINSGEFDSLIEQVMQKPVEEMKELYNNRDIEK